MSLPYSKLLAQLPGGGNATQAAARLGTVVSLAGEAVAGNSVCEIGELPGLTGDSPGMHPPPPTDPLHNHLTLRGLLVLLCQPQHAFKCKNKWIGWPGRGWPAALTVRSGTTWCDQRQARHPPPTCPPTLCTTTTPCL